MPPSVPPEAESDVEQVLEAIVYLYTESRRLTKELARRADLTAPQLMVLKLLEQTGDLSLSELSERLRAQNSTVTGIVDRMERETLVTRERSTEDRRVVRLRLTPKGRRIVQDLPPLPIEILRGAVESLSVAEVRDLVKILGKVTRRVKQAVPREGEAPPRGASGS